MNRFGNRLPVAVLLLALGMSSISCTRKESFDNPFDPNVSVLPPKSLKVLSMTDSSLTVQWSAEYNILASAQKAASAIVVEQSLNDTTFSIIDSLNAADSSGTIKREFQTNRLYFFRVYAAIGTKKTDVSNVVKVNLSFLAPANFTSTLVTETKREFTWQNAGNLAAYISIQRKLGQTGTYSTVGKVPATSTAFTDTSAIVTDTTYYYRICAVSGSGTRSPYDSLSVYLDFPSPTDLHMTCLSPTSVQLAWTDSSNFESGYRLLESVNNQPYELLSLLAKDSTSYTLTNLNKADSYHFRIQGYTPYNSSGYSALSISCVASQVQLLYTRQVRRTGVPVYSMTFSPDGKTLACGGEYYIDLFRVGDGLHLASLPHDYNFPVWDVKYSPDGSILASAHGGAVYLWNASTYQRIGRLYYYGTNDVYSLAFTPGGDTIAAEAGGNVQVWRLSDDSLVNQFSDNAFFDHSIALSPDGKYLAAGDSLELFALSSGALVRSFPSGYGLSSIAFSPDGSMIVSIGNEVIHMWSMENGSLLRTFQEVPYADKLAFNAAGNLLAVAGRQDGLIDIYNVQTGNLVTSLTIPTQSASVAFSPLGNIIAAGDSQGNVYVWGFAGTWKTDF